MNIRILASKVIQFLGRTRISGTGEDDSVGLTLEDIVHKLETDSSVRTRDCA